jgi:hypothetical protein
MKNSLCLTICGVLLTFGSFSFAETETFWSQVGHDLASPVSTEARSILVPGALLTGVLLIERNNISDPWQRSVSQRQPLGSTSKFGDQMGQVIPNAIYAGSMWLYGYFKNNELATERSWVMIKASIYSGLFTDVFKSIAQEERPNGSNRQSFPSGHATSAFAFASVVHAEHGLAWGVPAYALASFVGYSRMNDNKHYFHDVVAGAVVGTSYGFGLHYRSLQQKPRALARSGGAGFEYSVLPVVSSSFHGLSLYGEF